MATLALSAAGAAVGSALLPSGVSVLGASISGAVIGRAVGAVAGSVIDDALFGPLAGSDGRSRVFEGPRFTDLRVSASTEGAPVPRVYGRSRLSGQLIWASEYDEEIIRTSEQTGGGGKGLGGGRRQSQTTTQIEYRYYANLAYGLCEGEITRVGRIWSDGKELNQSDFTIRVYRGDDNQMPDSLIEAKEGSGNAPAYRGLAYIVFERLPLARFGNRLPQLNFEVFRAVDDFEKTVKAVTLIPSAGEFTYEPEQVLRDVSGVTIPENVHTRQGGTDWSVAMDQLGEELANVGQVNLFASWFGDDLRIGQCTLRPKVEGPDKITSPHEWHVAGLDRGSAQTVSQYLQAPAFGGTPTDASIVAAIQDLKARGYGVTFTPFILMDVPQGNSLPDPYTGTTGQPLYPWRGRITVDPAPMVSGTPDKTSAATVQVNNFVGAAAVADFAIVGEDVVYSGPAEWSFRRMVLHYAHLCQAAGGVDAFIIGTEMRGATQIRDGASSYPFVSALVQLAADVKTILGSQTLVTYAADWSEYFGHQPADGTGDVYFHLDNLWASNNIDAVGIDIYWPLSDWRDGHSHLDRVAGAESIYDLDYLKGNIAGGEGFDWYYASAGDRDAQIRTPITDWAGKPWVFRYKDIKSWWTNQHFDRPGGVESATPTAWVPQSKPFWFAEVGCPAVDKGANQPNVFIDPKSSESSAPYYSRVTRDDLIQRRYLQAFFDYFDPDHEDYVAGSNPVSSVYSGRMADLSRMFAYTWDARPYPAFPLATDVWSDGGNWTFGHWLSGRMAGGPLGAVVAQIMTDFGFSKFRIGGLAGHMDGFVIDRILSVRQVLQPLELAFFFDSVETGEAISFVHRGQFGSVETLSLDDLVEVAADENLMTLVRGQETELPVSAKLTYIEGAGDYRQASVESRRLVANSDRVSSADMPIVMGQAQAQAIAESWLHDSWASRERGRFALPPSRLALEVGDVVTVEFDGRDYPLRIIQTRDGQAKDIEARSIDERIFQAPRTPNRDGSLSQPNVFGTADAVFLDLPILNGNDVVHAGWVAAYQAPWPGGVAFFRSPSDQGFLLNVVVNAACTLGVTASDFSSGPLSRFDRKNVLRVRLDNGDLTSVNESDLFAGANLAAVENADGGFEVIQFQTAELVDEATYDLSDLLRGQGGSEDQMRDPVVAGARFVLLDASLVQITMTADEIGLPFQWRFGPANLDIGETAYVTFEHTFNGRGLKPLSPAHIRSKRLGNDVEISWVRRTRINGDSWDVVDVPLGEDIEAYEIDILDGATVKRVLTSSLPNVVYSESEQIADFGAVQSTYSARVYQMSATYGRGIGRDALI